MFWILRNERSWVHDTDFEPAAVWMVDEIERERWASREK